MVRYAKREDLPRVNELRRQVNDLHVEGRPDVFKPGFNQMMQDFLYTIFESDNMDVIVAERENVICGFACVQYVRKPESPYSFARHFYDVDEFCVDGAFRRQGIATELIDFIKQEAKVKGFDRVELNMWEFNDGARAFYESVGFKTYRRYMEMEI